MCGLQAYAEAAVGTLNIEFRKRTTIGVELAARVCVLYSHLYSASTYVTILAKTIAVFR